MRKEIEKIPEKIYTIVSYAICSTDKRSDVAYQSSNEICSLIVERLEKMEFVISFPPDRQNGVVDWFNINNLINEIKGE